MIFLFWKTALVSSNPGAEFGGAKFLHAFIVRQSLSSKAKYSALKRQDVPDDF